MQANQTLFTCRAYYWNEQFITELSPLKPIKGIYVQLHGFPGWVSKNYDVAEVLVQEGYKVYLPHHRGLGQSKGNFRFQQNIIATKQLLSEIQQSNPEHSLSLLGHSWGGYLTLRLRSFITDRMILLAPLAKFPTDERRYMLVKSLYNKNQSDLGEYTIESLEQEFEKLAADLDINSLKERSTTPRSLLIYGTNDDVIPPDLIESFSEEVKSGGLETLAFADDHRLSKRRPVLDKIQQWVRADP